MEPLVSSNLAGCDYDDETMTLTIAFVSGATYAYAGVSKDVYEGLKSSTSPGAYFARSIRNSYTGTRVG